MFNRYNEVCSYDWRKGGYEPKAAHFMQLVWKSATDLGIGKAEGMKNGRPYTYIVARYKPGITFDALKNVFKGRFNPSFCRNLFPSFKSDSLLNKTNSRFENKPSGSFPKQPRFFANKFANFQPLSSNSRLPPKSFNFQSTSQPNYGRYRNGYLNIARNYPQGKGQRNDKLSYYAGNARGTVNGYRSRLSTTTSEYYPKQAEVLEEFIEGDDPAGKREYGVGNNDQYLKHERFTPSLIPLINSEDAEIDDDDDDDEEEEEDLERKAQVPKHSRHA